MFPCMYACITHTLCNIQIRINPSISSNSYYFLMEISKILSFSLLKYIPHHCLWSVFCAMAPSFTPVSGLLLMNFSSTLPQAQPLLNTILFSIFYNLHRNKRTEAHLSLRSVRRKQAYICIFTASLIYIEASETSRTTQRDRLKIAKIKEVREHVGSCILCNSLHDSWEMGRVHQRMDDWIKKT